MIDAYGHLLQVTESMTSQCHLDVPFLGTHRLHLSLTRTLIPFQPPI